METRVFPEFQLIAQGNFHAIALVCTNHQRLDVLTLNAILHATWVMMSFDLTRISIFGFFFTNLIDIIGQDIHVTRVVIQPLVQGNLHINNRNIIVSNLSECGTFPTTTHGHWLNVWIRIKQVVPFPGTILMHHGHGVESTRLRIGHFFLHLFH